MFKLSALAALVFCLAASAQAEVLVIDRDSMVVDGGTYDYMQDASSVRYITIRNVTFRNEKPVVDGQNPRGGLFFQGCRYITIENCLIDGQFRSCRGVRLDGCSNVDIIGNEICNLNDDGIRLEGCARINITDNLIHSLFACGTDGIRKGCSCQNGHSDGIQAITVTKLQVHRNIVFGNTGTSGMMFGSGTAQSNLRDAVISNNLVHTPKAASAVYMRAGLIDVQFYNNTFLGGKFFSCYFDPNGGLSDIEVVNNIFTYKWTWNIPYDSTEHYIHNNVMKLDVVSETYPLPASNMLQTDPGLADMPGNNDTTGITVDDFMLGAGSPCIDAGLIRTDVPETDYRGYGRRGTTDIGGLEYNGIVSGIRDSYFAAARAAGEVSVSPQPMYGSVLFTEHRDGMEHDVCRVYDHSGQLVATPGTSRTWDGTDLAGTRVKAGIYYFTFEGRLGTVTGRIIKAQ